MSRIMKCICDGCGKEIDGRAVQFHAVEVDDSGDFITNDNGEYIWENKKDYCRDCTQEIINFAETLPERSAEIEKPPTMKEMLEAGKSTEEIVRVTGCKRESVSTMRSKMKQQSAKNKKTGSEEQTEPEPKEQAPVECSKVMKTCEYAARNGGQYTCDYMLKEGSSRGCPPEQCTKYKKKSRKG